MQHFWRLFSDCNQIQSADISSLAVELPNFKGLNICYYNVCLLTNKLDQIKLLLAFPSRKARMEIRIYTSWYLRNSSWRLLVKRLLLGPMVFYEGWRITYICSITFSGNEEVRTLHWWNWMHLTWTELPAYEATFGFVHFFVYLPQMLRICVYWNLCRPKSTARIMALIYSSFCFVEI